MLSSDYLSLSSRFQDRGRRTLARCILLARKLTAYSFVTGSVVLKPRNGDMKRSHSRGINRAFRAAVDEDIIEKGGNQSTRNRA